MKSKIISLAAAAMALTALTACDDAWNTGADNGGEGKVAITTTVRSDVQVASRAVTGEELSEKLLLWISSEKGLVREYYGQENIPASVSLVAGRYTVQAWTGDSVPASFDDKWFKGSTAFNVEAGKTTPVDVVCKIANVVASVKYDESVPEVISDYTLTIGHLTGTLTFEGDDTRKGYFMMNSRAKDLDWTLSGKLADGTEFTKTGTIYDVKPATEYVLNVKYNTSSDEIGGGYFTIDIDETEVVVEDEIVISVAPTIKGLGFNIDEPLAKEAGTVGRRSLFITASSSLKSVLLDCEYFTEWLGLGGSDFDLMAISDEVRQALAAKGINFVYNYLEDEDISSMKLNFEPEFTDALTDGKYAIGVTATDGTDKTSSAVFNIEISDEPVKLLETAPADAWATKMTLSATQVKDGLSNVMFNYRALGQQAWTQVAPTSTESRATVYTVELTGLEPATDYEYTVSCTQADGAEFMSSDVRTFTTAATPQLPNAGFEDWDESGKAYLLCAPGGEIFWDSGNHGSATMSKNVTVKDEAVKHSGNYSAKLQSQFVGLGGLIGKFAAGNVFIGKYLDTEGTNGVLGWGRSFSARPVALKGYVKYTPANTEYSDNTDLYPKNVMDQAILYVALLDGSKAQGDAAFPDYPVVVKTAKQSDGKPKLFNKDGADVIAYGEILFSEATAGDGMVEFTVPINYNRTDILPSYIVCTASASKGGDYFAGGASVMYLDDLELVYE